MQQELIDKKADDLCLKSCTFDDECDFCDNPQNKTFCRSGGFEYNDDFYWICGKCLLSISNKYPHLGDMALLKKIDEIQESLPVKLPF